MATQPEQVKAASRYAALRLNTSPDDVEAPATLPADAISLRLEQSALQPRYPRIDPARDALLTGFGRATLEDRYLMPGETPQQLFARVARAYADDADHA